jgi:hypothetical protein
VLIGVEAFLSAGGDSMKTLGMLAALMTVACAASAQGPAEGPAVRVVVTAEPRHGKTVSPLSDKDVTVTSGKDRLSVLEFVPATGDRGAAQLMILLDDGSTSTIGTQFQDLKTFINQLQLNMQLAIGYMRNGTADMVQDFTADHAAAANKLRLPLGVPGVNGSPYFSLVDVLKKWPATDARHEVLMITDGIDRFGGSGPANPYVDQAVQQAQRAGVVIHSIFWSGSGHAAHSYRAVNWGLNYLSELADGTGGEAYWQGFGDPVSFAPFLEDLHNRLDRQYLLSLRAKPLNKPEFQSIRIRTELPDVELVGPTQVWVPATR